MRKRKRWNGLEVKKFVEDENYSLIKIENWDWVKKEDRILVSCKKHKEYDVSWGNFKNGKRCAKCAKQHRYSHEEICEEVKKLNKNYIVEEDSPLYENAYTKLRLSCKNNHKFFICWHDLKSGYGCKYCAGNYQFNHELICEKIKNFNEGYSVCEDSDRYEIASKKIKLMCPEGHKFLMDWNHFKSGNRCSVCYVLKSKGVKMIYDILKKYKVSFEIEHFFDDLASEGGKRLRYDFGVYKEDSTVGLIEFDGLQHFEPVRFGGRKKEAEKSFTKTKKHDIIKNEYAKQNNIPLLRIPYYESDNIESILIQWLKDEGVL